MTALQTTVKLDIRILGGLYEVVAWDNNHHIWQPVDKFASLGEAASFRLMLEKMPSLVSAQLIRHFA